MALMRRMRSAATSASPGALAIESDMRFLRDDCTGLRRRTRTASRLVTPSRWRHGQVETVVLTGNARASTNGCVSLGVPQINYQSKCQIRNPAGADQRELNNSRPDSMVAFTLPVFSICTAILMAAAALTPVMTLTYWKSEPPVT